MQLTNFITAALLAATATALPAPEPNNALESRTLGYIICLKEGGKYDWFKHKCELPEKGCEDGKHWDDKKKGCYPDNDYPTCDHGKEWNGKECDYPCYEEPKCDKYQHGWCSKDKDHYVTYTFGHDWCKKDGHNKVWCSDDKDAKDNCGKQY